MFTVAKMQKVRSPPANISARVESRTKVSFCFIRITHHCHSLKTNGAGVGANQCCSGDIIKHMVVRLTSVKGVAMAMMMTIICCRCCCCRCGRRQNTVWRKCVYVCFCASTWVSWQPPEEGPGHRTSLLQGPLPCSRSPNQWEQRGEGVQQLQNSLKSRRSGRM